MGSITRERFSNHANATCCVDALHLQPLEAAMNGLGQVLRAGIVNPLPRSDAFPATLGGDDQTSGIRGKSLGDELLGDVRAIRISGIDEVHAKLDGAAKRGN